MNRTIIEIHPMFIPEEERTRLNIYPESNFGYAALQTSVTSLPPMIDEIGYLEVLLFDNQESIGFGRRPNDALIDLYFKLDKLKVEGLITSTFEQIDYEVSSLWDEEDEDEEEDEEDESQKIDAISASRIELLESI